MFRSLLTELQDVVERLPDKASICHRDWKVTYGKLGTQIGGAAAVLHNRIAPGDRVALLIDNSAEYAATCYGTWMAGGVVVGLNTALKADVLANLVAHCGARCLVAESGHRELSRLRERIGSSTQIITLPLPGDLGHGPSGTLPNVPIHETTLGAIIYTSGTTGRPKGVMLSHGNLVANTASIREYLPIREDDKALCVLPFYYSYGSSVLHTHLVGGATLVLENSFMYPHRVMRRAEMERITSLAGVPSTFRLLLRRTTLSSFDLSSLRYVTQAGGHLDEASIRQFREQLPEADFVVMYGQTEATARLAYVPSSDLSRKPGSAGRAIPGVELTVRNEADDDLPAGEVGEVCARGANVMMGYWADPAETAKVLKDGWLHTGDLGHVDDEGYLFLRGRSRDMIKSGAHRIDPAEIEEVARRVPGIEDVAVVGVEDEVLGQAVKACVIAARADERLRQDLLRACRTALPLYMLPKVVEFRDDFPRTGSGKIKKYLL